VTSCFAAGLAAVLYFDYARPRMAWLAAASLLVAGTSFLDDRLQLPAATRIVSHFIAAGVLMYGGFVLDTTTLPGVTWSLPAALALVVTPLYIVWMINLYNFMDGSDGLAGGMTVFGFGAYALGAWLAGDAMFAVVAASIAAAAAAFLAFNFHPAKVFMGDAGSIPLGFLAAAVGLTGWHAGHWPLWFPVLVFSPFIIDASVTLARRLLRGEAIWRAHRTHYYQRLVQLGWGHRDTALAEYALMAFCGATALWALGQAPAIQWVTLAAAAFVYVALAAIVDTAWRRHTRTLNVRPS
jgi:UDP-N-acetylmuramyl pentapeptide phosphotransferase/UDP-N-acetylglucosamine-1-phosphate transferase